MDLAAVSTILGGPRALGGKLQTEMDLFELSTKGIRRAAVSNLARYLSFSSKQMTALLPVTERTLQRCKPEQRLSPVVSEQVLQLAELAARGVDVFGDQEKFLGWMGDPSMALGGKIPLSLLSSRYGLRMVLDELTRIEHGVHY